MADAVLHKSGFVPNKHVDVLRQAMAENRTHAEMQTLTGLAGGTVTTYVNRLKAEDREAARAARRDAIAAQGDPTPLPLPASPAPSGVNHSAVRNATALLDGHFSKTSLERALFLCLLQTPDALTGDALIGTLNAKTVGHRPLTDVFTQARATLAENDIGIAARFYVSQIEGVDHYRFVHWPHRRR